VRDGHTYEFAVSAVFAGLEGPRSPPVRLTVHVSRPPPPTDLLATADDTGTVALRWTAPPGAVWFTVYQRGPGQPAFQPLDVTDSRLSTVSVGPLAQNQSYDFAVSASNSAGESAMSTVVTAVAHADPPAAPGPLRATVLSGGRVALSWGSPADAAPPASRALEPGPPPVLFHVYQRDLTLGEASFTPWPAGTDTSQVEADTLRTGHTYEFTVGAVTVGGAGPLADPVQVTVTGGLPGVVGRLTATPGDGQVALRWRPVPGPAIEYVVYRRDLSTGDDGYTQLPYPVISDALTDPTVHNGDLYLYRVAAANVHGLAGPSVAVFAQPLPPVPPAPTGLRAVPGDGSAALSWDAPAAGVYYFVYRRDATTHEAFQRLTLPVTTGPSFTDGFLINGDTYEYKVSATNLAGEGPASTVVSVVPEVTVVPTKGP
jgi:fibronectin type 3 domain-containing protein